MAISQQPHKTFCKAHDLMSLRQTAERVLKNLLKDSYIRHMIILRPPCVHVPNAEYVCECLNEAFFIHCIRFCKSAVEIKYEELHHHVILAFACTLSLQPRK